ncbi:MAG: HEAT repeat domain-containing protein [Actinomycetota bacterium]|nr:HEAT repeat domain-containing protein [Actinomycetota bacterium]
MSLNSKITCERLWGFECELVLSEDSNYVCPEEDHHDPELHRLVTLAIDDGFDPGLIGDVLHGRKRLEPGHDFIKFLSYTPEGRKYAAHSVNVPTYSVEQVKYISSNYKLTEVASAPNTAPETLEYLATLGSVSVRIAVAKNFNTPADSLRRLYREGPFEVILGIAQNIAAPPDLLNTIAKRHLAAAGKYLATNKGSNSEVLTLLVEAVDPYTRIQVAANSIADEETQLQLAEDPDWRVRYALGRSKSVSQNVLSRLFHDDREAVRSAVAYNSGTPVEILEQLATEEAYVVRYRLAQNSKLPLSIFIRLLNDTDQAVRRVSTTNPYSPFFYGESEMRKVVEEQPHYSWVNLLSNSEVPEDLKSHIRDNAYLQRDIALNEYMAMDRKNLFLLADLVADGMLNMPFESQLHVVQQLCHHPKDSDRLEEFAFHVLRENDFSQEIRVRIRSMITNNFKGESTRIQAILRHTVAA